MSVRLDSHPPFASVGLVCSCGKAVAGIEGVIACQHCGAVYSVGVLVLVERRPREGEVASTTERAESSDAYASSISARS